MMRSVLLGGLAVALACGCQGQGGSGSSSPHAGTASAPVTSGAAGGVASPASGSAVGSGIGTASGGSTGAGGTGAGGTAGPPTVGAWRARASMITARRNVATAVTDTGKIFVMGGLADSTTNNPRASTANEEYDPATDTWTTRAPMPVGRCRHGAVFSGGKIYVVGGAGSDPAIGMPPDPATMDVYDPATDTWRIGPSPATPRRDLGALLFAGKIWALSGVSDTGGFPGYSKADIFDPLAGTWTFGAVDCPVVGESSATSAAVGNTLYVVDTYNGGTLLAASSTATSFTTLGQTYPVGRDSGAVALNGRVYLMGGASAQTSPYGGTVTDVQSFDGASPGALFSHAPLLEGREAFGVATWQGKIYVFGGGQSFPYPFGPFGMINAYKPTNAVEAFSP